MVPDHDLVRQAAADSPAAFEELVRRYEGRIYGFVHQLCGHRADALDITQDTFLRAFHSLEKFDFRYPFACWLFSIARRRSIDHHRSQQRRRLADDPIPDRADPDDPGKLLCRAEDQRNLWEAAREKLPTAQYEALWLKYVEDMDVAQISRALHKTKTHVKVLLFRARKALARELTRESSQVLDGKAALASLSARTTAL